MAEARQQATAELSEAAASACIAWAAASGKTFVVMVLVVVAVGSSSCTFAIVTVVAEFCLIAVCGSCGVSSAGAARLVLVISLAHVLIPRRAGSCARAFPRFCLVG